MIGHSTRYLFNFLRAGIAIFVCTFLLSSPSAFTANVWLTWDPNSEEDLMGYRIYYGYESRDYDFSQEILDGVLCEVQSLEEGVTYYFAATAFDRDGNESGYSNEVVYTPPCIYSIAPTSSSYTAAGGTGSIDVSAQSACPWTVTSDVPWIGVTSNSSGKGNGTINFSVMSNPGTESRTGTLSVAGKTFHLTQAGVPQYTLTTLKGGSGHGLVMADPPGALFPEGTMVTLTATPDPDSIFSGWSGSVTGPSPVVTVTMKADTVVTATFSLIILVETVSTPAAPGGPVSGYPGAGFTYATGGSSSNLGHQVQYLFDWGDGSNSGWLPVGTTSASKSWAAAGTYTIKAQAGCATHSSVTSDWSPGFSVAISLLQPANLTASDGTYADKVRVTWEASPGATSYKVFRNTSDDSSSAQEIGISTALSYDDLTAAEGTPYWYWAKASYSGGDSEFSNGDSGYVALSWHSESVNWEVYYGNNWNRSGTVAKPGAVRVRLHFTTISVEAWYDHLRTDVGEDWSGDYSNVTSNEKVGDAIELTLTSDWSVTGYFIIDRVDWQGTSAGPATKSGPLFESGDESIFESGWEDGEVYGFGDRVEYSKNVAGYLNSSSPPPECSERYRERVRTGDYSLMIAGYSRASYAYCYYRVFDLNLSVVSGMKIGYWIYHSKGTPKISVDGHFSDGSTLRDYYKNGYLTDQYGVRIHPGKRKDPMNQWYYVEVDLSRAAGKTLAFIMFAFDNDSDGFTGQYRAYVDDFKIFHSTP